jgi:formate dehydrogenase assembly factor FdhD
MDTVNAHLHRRTTQVNAFATTVSLVLLVNGKRCSCRCTDARTTAMVKGYALMEGVVATLAGRAMIA